MKENHAVKLNEMKALCCPAESYRLKNILAGNYEREQTKRDKED